MPRIQNIAANVLNSCRRLNPNIGFCPPHRLPALTTIATMIFGICMLQRALALSTPNAASKAALGARCPLLALSGQSSCARVCPLLEASSTGRRNTLSLRKKIDYRPISQRFRGGTRAAEKIALWDSWLRRGSLKAIGRAFGKPSSLFIASWPPVLRRPVEITDNSGHWPELVLNGLVANDPFRTSGLITV